MITHYAAELPAIIQHPRDLRLCVVAGEFRDPLTVLAQRTLEIGALRLDLRIIGESHWVTVSSAGKPLFHEILACMELDSKRCRHQHIFSDLRAHQVRRRGYQVAVTIDQPVDDAPMPDDAEALVVNFPQIYGIQPQTHLYWQAQISDQRVRWWTLHTYPQTHSVTRVYSSSLVDFGQLATGGWDDEP
ncbi:MAG: DUF2617 family protein [Anaerolineae bacterium]|nr:DUF2617 family protein [Anaerolineae bacterium]